MSSRKKRHGVTHEKLWGTLRKRGKKRELNQEEMTQYTGTIGGRIKRKTQHPTSQQQRIFEGDEKHVRFWGRRGDDVRLLGSNVILQLKG